MIRIRAKQLQKNQNGFLFWQLLYIIYGVFTHAWQSKQFDEYQMEMFLFDKMREKKEELRKVQIVYLWMM